jgi:hypothetical protein
LENARLFKAEPERVADDLPRFVEVLRGQKLNIPLVATDITSMKTPHAETVLRTMARFSIKRLRLGFFAYGPNHWPPDRLKEIAPALRDIADACKELNLQAGFQNHSGRQSVGAPVWDVFSMIRDLDSTSVLFRHRPCDGRRVVWRWKRGWSSRS